VFYKFPDDFEALEPEKGFFVHLVSGHNLMFSHVTLEPHSVASLHTHPQEQMGIILEGEFEMMIGHEKKILKKGDMYRVPPDVMHGGQTLAQSALILDVFSPPRDKYKT
jgi:quercetin dioxygenase-like cupin family protein